MSPAELDEKQKIIKKYNLSKTDIEYMISYKQSLNKQSNNHTLSQSDINRLKNTYLQQ